jgi:nicotinate-nucleotide adenylyltransferase
VEHYLKSAFFGGTFDPIHFGHLNLALHLLETVGLDRIFFCPAYVSPEKHQSFPSASAENRFQMVELAIQEIPQFVALSYEIERKGPSYTIDTLRYLKKEFPEDQWHLILGEDVLHGLSRWKEVEELLALAPPLVGSRPGDKFPALPKALSEWVEKGRVDIPTMEISATEIRNRLNQKKYCGHLTSTKVLDYIIENRLYSSSNAK